MHDTVAQSAYMIGLGIETAMELAEKEGSESRRELLAKLAATHDLSKSAMWDLRHPIDMGPIFEGRELGHALRSHASTFAKITSIRTDFVQSGEEPRLPTITRRLVFSIAHNAMTNAFRHAQAARVTILLDFSDWGLQMSVDDDGIGLPEDYANRGYGFRSMRTDAERLGGDLAISAGGSGQGTRITCAIPYGADTGGA